MTNKEIRNITSESLRDWFKKEKWVRISSSGNIAGDCGTSKDKTNPDRCLPKAKAQSLTKGQRAATAAKKKKAGSKGKTVVKNTKKATVTEMELPSSIVSKINTKVKDPSTMAQAILHYINSVADKEAPSIFKNPKLRRALEILKDLGNDKPSNETADPQDGKAAPYGSGYQTTKEIKRPSIQGLKRKLRRSLTKEDLRNLVAGIIAEMKNKKKKPATYAGKPVIVHMNGPETEWKVEILGNGKIVDYIDMMANLKFDDGTDYRDYLKEEPIQEDDRCTRLAKSKYDTWPSAYASGAVVRCRQGKIWKKE